MLYLEIFLPYCICTKGFSYIARASNDVLYCVFEFFLAHYRDAISKLADNDLSALQMMTLMQKLGGQARDTLIQNPFVMDDFKSYLLLFVGLLASIFATKKSFELDDPYPGYGKISKSRMTY